MIAIGSDHRGYIMKKKIKTFLKTKGYGVIDVGTDNPDPVDYPLYAKKVAESIISNAAEKGILICGSGIGMCMAANKFKGIRSAVIRGVKDVEVCVKHNNANVICFGSDRTGLKKAKLMIITFMNTKFEGGRHQRRLNLMRGC